MYSGSIANTFTRYKTGIHPRKQGKRYPARLPDAMSAQGSLPDTMETVTIFHSAGCMVLTIYIHNEVFLTRYATPGTVSTEIQPVSSTVSVRTASCVPIGSAVSCVPAGIPVCHFTSSYGSYWQRYRIVSPFFCGSIAVPFSMIRRPPIVTLHASSSKCTSTVEPDSYTTFFQP